ncbi:hypothetical protein VPG91_11675 [Nitrospirillum amazonense]|uniref:hypothetical protein n=1 Tax=Nitrospirillum amazonense TaxID=28077 RepID=UPI002DD44288|nr:hypothetical protein [Nitrospirillum amazonense]MEC4591649.1 hypothetical protein [Nitrospirillum amazonense]
MNMTTAHCPRCDHMQFVPDGADLRAAECRNCFHPGLMSGVGNPFVSQAVEALTQAERETAQALAEGEAA